LRSIIIFLSIIFIPIIQVSGHLVGIKAFLSDNPPVSDGKPDDPGWKTAIPFTGFKMVEPDPVSMPSENTEVRVIYTRSGICFSIRRFDARRLNITRFPLYYPGKRTFSLEGSATPLAIKADFSGRFDPGTSST